MHKSAEAYPEQQIVQWHEHEKSLRWMSWQIALAMEQIVLLYKKKIAPGKPLKQGKNNSNVRIKS